MTPKEKAESLVEKYRKTTSYQYQEYAGAHYSTFEHEKETLIECALITVEEILKEIDDDFWEQVKIEINKL